MPGNRVFLTDFGLAKATPTGSKYTRTGQALGTPAYMSPEQARGETAALTPATDVWSLACLLYECLASRRAFEGATPAEVIGAVLTREPVPLQRIRPEVPAGVETLVRAALAKRAADRLASAEALRDDLDRVLKGEPPEAAPRRSGRPVLLAACAVLTLGAGAVALAWPRAGPPPTTAVRSEAEALAARAWALRTSDPRQAAGLLEQALRADVGRHDWRIERGLLLWAFGEGSQAREEWAAIPPTAPEARRARLCLGLEPLFELVQDRLGGEKARPEFEALLTGGGVEGRLARGALALIAGEWAGSRALLGGIPGWEAAYLRAVLEVGDPNGSQAVALREYGAALAEGIPFAWAWYDCGLCRQGQGDVAGAIEDYERALQMNPRYAKAWNNLGLMRKRQGDVVRAFRAYEEALRNEPGMAQAWNNRGVARHDLGDDLGAIADFGKAIEADPAYVEAWYGRALTRAARRDFAAAIDDFGQALALNSQHAKAWCSRGLARQNSGDLRGAIEDFDQALRVDPRLGEAWANRGRARAALGDSAGALADLDRAVQVNPDLAGAWFGRGNLRCDRGDPRGALQDYGRALEIHQRFPEVWRNRGLVREDLGDLAGAVTDYAKALEFAPPAWAYQEATETDLARARAALAAQAKDK